MSRLIVLIYLTFAVTVFAGDPSLEGSSTEESRFASVNFLYDILDQLKKGDFKDLTPQNRFSELLQSEAALTRFWESFFEYQRSHLLDYHEFLVRTEHVSHFEAERDMGVEVEFAFSGNVVSVDISRGDRQHILKRFYNHVDPLTFLLGKMSAEQFQWFRQRFLSEFKLNSQSLQRIQELKERRDFLNATSLAFQIANYNDLNEAKTRILLDQAIFNVHTLSHENPVYVADVQTFQLIYLASNGLYRKIPHITAASIRAQMLLKDVVELGLDRRDQPLRDIVGRLPSLKKYSCLAYFL